MYTVPSSQAAATWNSNPTLLGRSSTATVTTPPPSSPTSPTRSGRLRGLSYLRNYTHNHILSRDNHSNSSSQQRPSVARATSYPSPTSPPSDRAPTATSPVDIVTRQTLPTAQRSTTDLTSARSSTPETSGWLPTVGGHSVASRIASEPQSTATASSSAVLASNSSTTGASGLTTSMARTRSATVSGATDMPQVDGNARNGNEAPVLASPNGANNMNHQLPSIRFAAHQDPRAARPSLVFPPLSRILPTGKEVIKVGRYSERDNLPLQLTNVPSASPVGFKSKVVSRRHCEFWCTGGRWFIKDVKSSSGTFLNHIRLSSPGTESRPFPVNDGDIVQLGIDFKGGEDMIFRCVKIRVELNKGWQMGPSSFNVQSHKRLRELNNAGKPSSGSSQDCSICLGPIAPCQSLFVAPCSHTWHYKCIRIIINGPHWPHFICPNCRSVADLEAEVDDPFAEDEWEQVEGAATSDDREAREATVAPEEPVLAFSRHTRQANTSEATQAAVRPPKENSDHEHSAPSDAEVADASDNSDGQVTSSIGYLNIRDSPSRSSSSDSQHRVSNATVQPVNITGRKPVPSSSSSRLGQPSTRNARDTTRTPSPNELHPSSIDVGTGVEGPMTPRNDAGPFIFDGSAGRAAALASVASMTLDEAADSPLPSGTSQQHRSATS